MPGLFWGDMTREQINAVAAEAVAVISVGAVEQHGPHLPTQTDAYVVTHVARAAVERIPEEVTAIVLPTMPFGCSEHHVPFGATLSVKAQTLTAVLLDLLSSLRRAGIERALIVNGHGGNAELCGMVAKQGAIELDMAVAAASYWMTVPPEPDIPGHAGSFETSVMLHLAPDLVVRDNFAGAGGNLLAPGHPGVVLEDPRHWRSLGGWTDDPAQAATDRGGRLLNTAAEELGKLIVRLAKQRRPVAETSGPPNG